MGAGQCDLYKGTHGDNPDNIPEELKGKIRLPSDDSQLKHIFRDAEGHLPDTPENRRLLTEVANDRSSHAGRDIRGNDWNIMKTEDGSQIWVISRDGKIQNGGINNPPRVWDDDTGLNINPFKKRGER